MSIKMTNLTMEWTDSGAVVSYESSLLLDIRCPRCNAKVASGFEHRCGDQLMATAERPKAKTRPRTRSSNK